MIDAILAGCVSIGVSAGYLYRADFERYSIITTGVYKRVSRSAITSASGEWEYECKECGSEIETVEERKYWKEIVVAGMPLVRYDRGRSHYCEEHLSFEMRDGLDGAKPEYAERLPISLIKGLAKFVASLRVSPVEKSDNDPFGETVQSVNTGIQLIPIAIIVLFGAMFIKMFSILHVNTAVEK